MVLYDNTKSLIIPYVTGRKGEEWNKAKLAEQLKQNVYPKHKARKKKCGRGKHPCSSPNR